MIGRKGWLSRGKVPDAERVRGRVLLVDPTAHLAAGLRGHLEIEGYEVQDEKDAGSAFDAISRFGPDLVLLNVIVPGTGGLEFLQRFRGRGHTQSVLVLSDRSDQVDRLIAFRSGADDFMTKPFDLLELLVRLERLMFRTPGSVQPLSPVQFGSVTLHEGTRTVLRHGKDIPLALKEFDLAVALIRRAGEAVSRAELLRDVWGHKATVRTRTVDTHIFHLRRKLEDEPNSPRHFLSVYKFGYRFEF